MSSFLRYLSALCLLLISSHPASAAVVVKGGNNGTVSCDTYCARFQWGNDSGSCVFARRSDNGAALECDEVPGLFGAELTCGCNTAIFKPGNNGTASCNDYCARGSPGPVAQCLTSRRGDNGQELGCDAVPGFLVGAMFECYCHTFDQDKADLQTYHDQLQAQQQNDNGRLSSLSSQASSLTARQNQLPGLIAAANADQASAQQDLGAQQSALNGAMGRLSDRSQALTAAQSEQSHRESEANTAANAETASKAHLGQVTAQKSAAEQQLSALEDRKTTLENQLTQLTSSATTQNAGLDQAKAVAEAAPTDAQRLVAQSGRLMGGGRTCSGFEVSAHDIRIAWHCVADLNDAAIKNLTFTDSANGTHQVTGVSTKDPSHDAATLSLASNDAAFVDLGVAPAAGAMVRLLAWDVEHDTLSLSDECKILSLDLMSGMIRHNCPSAPGTSGGALLQGGKIVGVHVGSLADGTKVATYLQTADKRAPDAGLLAGLKPEYDCSTDCRAASYDRVNTPCPTLRNPFRVCGNDVFDPDRFSICEAARSADCSAQAAAADSHRAFHSMGVEAGNLMASVHSIEAQVAGETQNVANLRGRVDALEHQLGAAQATLANVRGQVSDVASRVADTNGRITAVEQGITTAQQATRNAINLRDQATAAAEGLGAQADQVSAALRVTSDRIATDTTLVGDEAAKVAAAVAKDTNVRQAVATVKTVVTVAADLPKVAEPPSVAKAIDDLRHTSEDPINLAPLMERIGDGAKQALVAVAARVKAALHDFAVAVKQDENAAVATWHKWFASGDGDVVVFPDIYTPWLTDSVCLSRAKERLDAYRSELKSLGLADWPGRPSGLTLENLAAADETLGHHVSALSAGLVEVKQNHCDSVGIDAPLQEALADAQEWQAWVRGARRQRL